MKPIVICTHAQMAEGLKSAAEIICGKQEKLYAVGLAEGEGLTELMEKLAALFAGFEETPLVLTDLYGATPFNASAAALATTDAMLLTGANLPMLLELLTARGDGELNEELSLFADSGREGIRIVSMREMFNNL